MSNPQPVTVRVIYDSTQKRRKGAVAYVSRRTGRRSAVILGVLNLLVAAAMYYGIWWKADPYIHVTMFFKTPVITEESNIDIEAAAAQMFGIPPTPKADLPPEEPQEDESRWSGTTTQKLIPATAYGWLTLATAGCCALALASGASLGGGLGGHRAVRFTGLLLTLFLVGGLSYGAYQIWTEYGYGFPVEHFRFGMAGIAALAMALGLAVSPVGRGLRRVTRLAAFSVILAGIGSAVGVYLWNQAGAIEADYATASMLGMIFMGHSVWGWLLLVFSLRL